MLIIGDIREKPARINVRRQFAIAMSQSNVKNETFGVTLLDASSRKDMNNMSFASPRIK